MEVDDATLEEWEAAIPRKASQAFSEARAEALQRTGSVTVVRGQSLVELRADGTTVEIKTVRVWTEARPGRKIRIP